MSDAGFRLAATIDAAALAERYARTGRVQIAPFLDEADAIALAAHLVARDERIEGKIFISHPHWDHINAIPFFAPSTRRIFLLVAPFANAARADVAPLLVAALAAFVRSFSFRALRQTRGHR